MYQVQVYCTDIKKVMGWIDCEGLITSLRFRAATWPDKVSAKAVADKVKDCGFPTPIVGRVKTY